MFYVRLVVSISTGLYLWYLCVLLIKHHPTNIIISTSHCVCSQLSDVVHYAVLLCVCVGGGGGPISYRVTGIKLCSFLMKTSLFAKVTNYL